MLLTILVTMFLNNHSKSYWYTLIVFIYVTSYIAGHVFLVISNSYSFAQAHTRVCQKLVRRGLHRELICSHLHDDCERPDNGKCGRAEEPPKELVVVLAHARRQPRAVMIELAHATFTFLAVTRSYRLLLTKNMHESVSEKLYMSASQNTKTFMSAYRYTNLHKYI